MKNFKVRVGGDSERIQKHLFTQGYSWSDGCKVQYTHAPFLFGNQHGNMGYAFSADVFNKKDVPEFTVREVLTL